MSQPCPICDHASFTTASAAEIEMEYCSHCRCFWLNQSPRLQPTDLQMRLRLHRQARHSYWNDFQTELQA